jgi:hypothetical protein
MYVYVVYCICAYSVLSLSLSLSDWASECVRACVARARERARRDTDGRTDRQTRTRQKSYTGRSFLHSLCECKGSSSALCKASGDITFKNRHLLFLLSPYSSVLPGGCNCCLRVLRDYQYCKTAHFFVPRYFWYKTVVPKTRTKSGFKTAGTNYYGGP